MADSNKVYIQALQDFTSSLQNLVDALVESSDKEDSSAAMDQFFGKNSDWFKLAKDISEDVAETKKTSKKSLDNTQKILQEVKAIKKGKEKGIFDKITDPDNKKGMVDGIKSIALIAGAVLAIGLAFKVIGQVDFASVIALSIAMPLIAYAISEISTIKNLTPKNLLMMSMAMVAGSAAIVAASWVLAEVQPISILNVLSASLGVGIAMLAVALPLSLLGDYDIADMLFLPVVAVLAAYAIVFASKILQDVSPVDIMKVAFASLAVGIALLAIAIPAKLMEKIDVANMLMLPVVAVLAAYAIVFASKILQDVSPVDIMKVALASLAVGVAMLAIAIPAKLMENMKLSSMLLLPVVAVLTALAIVAASHILQDVSPIDIMKVALASLAVGVAMLAIAIPAKLMENLKLSSMLLLPVVAVLTALAIVAASHILQGVAPIDLMQVATASLAIGITVVVGALVAWVIDKVGIEKVAIGSIGMIIVSAAIMVSSLILSVGSYDTYPSLDWAMGVGLSLLAFVPAMLIMGNPAMIIAALFGAISMAIVAASIVATSYILGAGDYGVYPTVDWISGVGLSMLAFIPALLVLSNPLLMFLLPFGMINLMMVAQSIVDVAGLLNGVDFSGGPTKEWAEGVGMSLIYFSEALSMATPSVWDWLTGSDLDSQIAGLHNVIDAMVDIANYLSANNAVFKNGPPKEWAEGVGLALKYFSEAMASTDQSVWDWLTGNTIDDKIMGMRKTIDAMVDIAAYLSEKNAVFTGGPSKAWAEGTGASIVAFSTAMVNLDEVDPEDTQEYIMYVVDAMVAAATALGPIDFSKVVDKKWLSGFDGMIKSFIKAGENYDEIEDGVDVLNYMAEEAGTIVENLEEAFSGNSNLMSYANGIKSMGDAYAHLAKSISNLNKELAEMQEKSIATLTAVSATILALSLSDSSNLKSVLEENTEALVDMFKQIADSQAEVQKNTAQTSPQKTPAPQVQKESPQTTEVKKQTSLLEQIKKELTTMNANMSRMAGNTDDMVDLMSTNKKKDAGIK